MNALLRCTECPRLAGFLADVRSRHPDYHARPVLPFGDPRARLLIVGLAPGMHGANRTGRPFTGDYAGILLYETLHAFGFGSLPESIAADDDLRLTDCRITNAVKCLPPANKPEPAEIKTCNRYLTAELQAAPEVRVILALGLVAHKAVLMALGLKQSALVFGHGARHALPPHELAPSGSRGRVLIDSYHCSRYNTQTRRLTSADFQDVFRKIRDELDA
ncbi:MAG: uracil-DNA glycosylase [Sulfuritalea sp.]|nr:uracil-DNA glycosylase [Sulfuritalea sp.]MDP1981089.1 uracil-DNA glycosylase [Sulfuritalea sp.]